MNERQSCPVGTVFFYQVLCFAEMIVRVGCPPSVSFSEQVSL